MDIIREIQIQAGVKKIFAAVSTQAGINGWLSKDSTIHAKAGEIIKIIFHPQSVPFDMHFRIDELTENKKILWSCVHNSNLAWLTTKISFDISGDDSSGILVFKHIDFPRDYDNKMEAGTWDNFMQSLKDYCETRTGHPWD